MSIARQLCFDGLRPDPPTVRSRAVAEEIATRIVETVNLDDFYWTREELPERIADVADEIQRRGAVQSIFYRLRKRQPPISDRGERACHPYGWDGIDDHCDHIVHDIAAEELFWAVERWEKEFGVSATK